MKKYYDTFIDPHGGQAPVPVSLDNSKAPGFPASGIEEGKDKKIKPCPFCGCEATIEQTGNDQLTIGCKTCAIYHVQRWAYFSKEWLEEKMIESWNKRFPASADSRELHSDLIDLLEAYGDKVLRTGENIVGDFLDKNKLSDSREEDAGY